MQWLVNIALIAMACQAIVRIWFYSDLFARLRAFIKLRLNAWAEESVRVPETTMQASLAELALANGEQPPVVPVNPVTIVRTPLSWEVALFSKVAPRWVYNLLSCPLCLTTHVALWLFLVCHALPMVLEEVGLGLIGLLFQLPVPVFAIVYLADIMGTVGTKLRGH